MVLLGMTARNERANAKPVAFLAHSFAADDAFIVSLFQNALKAAGWSVTTGQALVPLSVSEKVRVRIASANLVVVVFTRRHKIAEGHWTTSPWVIEEKAYSFGCKPRRPMILLLEHGIPNPGETGGLNGDLEYIPFDRSRVDTAIRRLREMLRSIGPT